MYIYKIIHRHDYVDFKKTGLYSGSDLDLADGYIHCSTEEQWPRILEKFFSREDKTILLKIDLTSIDEHIRWETSPRSGQVYPHVYGQLPFSCIVETKDLS